MCYIDSYIIQQHTSAAFYTIIIPLFYQMELCDEEPNLYTY